MNELDWVESAEFGEQKLQISREPNGIKENAWSSKLDQYGNEMKAFLSHPITENYH